MKFDVSNTVNREVRVVNRNFSLAEYGNAWTKMERFLFIECYNVIKDFYLAKNSDLITSFTSENIALKIPVSFLNSKLFSSKNRSKQLMDASRGLMDKTIYNSSVGRDGQVAFYFVNMFTFIQYDPKQDKHHIILKIPKEIYKDMIPIESYCQLDLQLLEEFNSGNTIRLYEIFKSYAFKKRFTITFESLRKRLGFFNQNKYQEWKHFNSKVLKPAVININEHKEFDIEVSYEKERGADNVCFVVIQHHKNKASIGSILSLDEVIDPVERKLNLIQDKYISTLINNCDDKKLISNPVELKEWIISDLIYQQKKSEDFNWVYACNAISKQLRLGVYTQPYSHLTKAEEG